MTLANLVLRSMPKRIGRDVVVKTIPIRDGLHAYLMEEKNTREDQPCLVYFHGGGFVFPASRYHVYNAAEYVRTGCKVLFVDYRLAPKHTYPTANEDCFAAYLWALEQNEYHIDKTRLALGGDSAGGYLAADVMRRIHESALTPPKLLLLIYPVLDARMQTPSMREYCGTPMWNSRLNRKMWELFLHGTAVISPSENADVSYFPPVYLETAQFDCLHDEGAAFVDLLRSQSVDVNFVETKGTMHGYDIVQKSPISQNSLQLRCNALKGAWGAVQE